MQVAQAQNQGQPMRPTGRHPCNLCQKVFDGKEKRVQHQKDAHSKPAATKNPPPTARAVPTPKSVAKPAPVKNSTSKSQLGGKTVATVVTAGTSVAGPSSQPIKGLDIPHRGNEYTKLSPADLADLEEPLLELCHSRQRLEKERYKFADGGLPSSASFGTTNPPTSASAVRAIVIDCEMAGAIGNDDELIHITIIDFFTGHVLLDRPVNPTRRIVDWRTAITGINAATMKAAVRNNTALQGWEAARAELWRVVGGDDPNSILIGHALHNDLDVLHIKLHAAKVIDTALLTAEAIFGVNTARRSRRKLGLKEICQSLFETEIRQADGPAKDKAVAHDSLEDALAAREVVLCRLLIPDEFETWAKQMQDVDKGKKRNKGKRMPWGRRHYDDTDDDEEVERWEDVVDWDMWPKSPPCSP